MSRAHAIQALADLNRQIAALEYRMTHHFSTFSAPVSMVIEVCLRAEDVKGNIRTKRERVELNDEKHPNELAAVLLLSQQVLKKQRDELQVAINTQLQILAGLYEQPQEGEEVA